MQRTARRPAPDHRRSRRLLRGLALAVALALAVGPTGCGDDEEVTDDRAATRGAASKADAKATKAGVSGATKATGAGAGKAGASAGGLKNPASMTDSELERYADWSPKPEPPMPEDFFAEAADNRDPFRPQEEVVAEAFTDDTDLERCVLSEYALDELKLIGIISGIPAPRALFLDPSGTDWKIGRGECISKSGGRVLRVRSDEVTVIEINTLTGAEVERTVALHPGRLDVRAALDSGDPTALKGTSLKKVDDGILGLGGGLGVVPGAGLAPPPLSLGMSSASFETHYGSCYAKKPSLGLIAGGGGEVFQRISSAGLCADLPGNLVVITAGRVSSIQAL